MIRPALPVIALLICLDTLACHVIVPARSAEPPPAQSATAPPAQSASATAQLAGPGNRIQWQGKSWFLTGANVPWYSWACDFGCGSNGGVSSPQVQAALSQTFAQAKANGVRTIRWWMFEGNPWQIETDSSGLPSSIKPSVYPDIDAALQLLEANDLYVDFVLFSGPSAVPNAWQTTPQGRAQLTSALSRLFAHYNGNPRILAWEVYNEPDLDIWNHGFDEASAQATVQAIATAVHANSTAYVTVGDAMLDGLPMWKGLGLDFYEAHWYDYMSSGNWCARCTDYAAVQARYGLDRPLVIGEFYADSSVDAAQRYADFYSKGYGGAWAWSLLPDHTNDKLAVDPAATLSLFQQHADAGPRSSGGGSPSPALPFPFHLYLPAIAVRQPARPREGALSSFARALIRQD